MKKLNLENLLIIISESTGIKINDLNSDSCANDFAKWDSLAHVKLMLEIQKANGKKISTSKMSELNSVKSILKFFN